MPIANDARQIGCQRCELCLVEVLGNYFTVADAARSLKKPSGHIHTWCQRLGINPIKLAGQHWISPADMAALRVAVVRARCRAGNRRGVGGRVAAGRVRVD